MNARLERESMDVRVTRAALDPAGVLAALPTPADGAVVLFVGVVREENDGRAVSGIHYDAYAEMAENVLREIAAEARERAGGARLAVAHRVGELAVGEASVVIGVATPHRAEAFDAARYVIEEIKRRLPVWKQERYADGASSWLPGAAPGGTR